MPTPSRTLRYSGSERPACRMNQTGVWRRRLAAGRREEGRCRRVRDGACDSVGHPRIFAGQAAWRHIGGAGRWPTVDLMVARHETHPGNAAAAGARGVPRGCGSDARGLPAPGGLLRGDAGAAAHRAVLVGAERPTSPSTRSDLGTGRLILLHDPAGNDAWDGTFRCVAYARADIDPELGLRPDAGRGRLVVADRGARRARRRPTTPRPAPSRASPPRASAGWPTRTAPPRSRSAPRGPPTSTRTARST